MGRAKKSLLAVTSFVLSIFILFFEIITAAITSFARPWGPLKQSFLHLIKIRNSLSKGLTQQYVQVIANSSISLMLAFAITYFQPQFIRVLVFLSFEVHQKFFGLITDVPRLSEILQSSQIMKNGLYYSYFLFGFLGLSTQCILTVDLLSLASIPTAIFYLFSVKTLKICMKLFKNIKHILATQKQIWLSCQYYQALLRDSTKVIYVIFIPILCYVMIGLSLYAISLALILLALRIISNIINNLALALDQVGFMLCLLKQSTKKTTQKETLKNQLQARVRTVSWIPILTTSMFQQTLDGCWPLGEESSSFTCLNSSIQGLEWLRIKLEFLREESEG